MNLAEIKPLLLPSLPLNERRSLPKCKAIYFVIDGETVLYIGKTVNLAHRLVNHHRLNEFKSNPRVAWLECSDKSLLPELEKALIKYFSPLLNGTKIQDADRRDKRVNVIMSGSVFKLLKELAETERRSQSQTAALLIEEALIARNLIKNTSTTLKGKNDP